MPTQYVSFTVTVTARVDCETERCDYGVPRSPVWDEPKPETISVSGFEIDGFSLAKCDKELLEYLEETASEVALTNGEWR